VSGTGSVSADWVVPVDGPPIENGVVRFEDGLIVAVGTGRGDRHYPGAAIVPGFVNAHSHLEYANYAGSATDSSSDPGSGCTSSARAGSPLPT